MKRGRRKKKLMRARTRRSREKSLNPKATIHLWNPGTDGGQLELAEDPEAQVWEFGEGSLPGLPGSGGRRTLGTSFPSLPKLPSLPRVWRQDSHPGWLCPQGLFVSQH